MTSVCLRLGAIHRSTNFFNLFGNGALEAGLKGKGNFASSKNSNVFFAACSFTKTKTNAKTKTKAFVPSCMF